MRRRLLRRDPLATSHRSTSRVFNASLHYATDLRARLGEAARVFSSRRQRSRSSIRPFIRRGRRRWRWSPKNSGCPQPLRRSRGRAHRSALYRVSHARRLAAGRASGSRWCEASRPLSAAATSCARCSPGCCGKRRPVPLRPVDGEAAMILLVNPRATRPSNRRFPLSVMAIGAALPADRSWEIVDGNLPAHGRRSPRSAPGSSARRDQATRSQRLRSPSCPARSWSARSRYRKRPKKALPGHSDRLGRQFRQPLSRPGAQCALCRLAGARPGRANLPRAARSDRRQARSRRSPRPGFRRQTDGNHVIAPERSWVGPGRTTRPALPQDRRRRLSSPDLPRPPVGRLPGVDRLPLRLQFLRRDLRLRPAREGPVARRVRPSISASSREPTAWIRSISTTTISSSTSAMRARSQRRSRRSACAGGAKRGSTCLAAFRTRPGARLRQAGLTMVFCGAESGSDAVLARDEQGHDHRRRSTKSPALTREHGIIPEFSLRVRRPRRARARNRKHPTLSSAG